ncbi:MAG: hypothetical protein ACOY0T_07830 [Myxococcota bacterium]
MAKTLRVLAGMFLLPACSILPGAQSGAARPASASRPPEPEVVVLEEALPSSGLPEEPQAQPRRVGDLVVHRFSGAYRKNPLVLTERVVDKHGNDWVVDLTLEEGVKVSRLRVRMDNEGRVSSVSRMDGGRERPASLDDYGALVEKTLLAADVNEGLLGAERSTCLLGARELDCETKSYKVWLAEKPATMRVITSPELPGQDVGGEITSHDGRLLYRSELVSFERGKDDASVAAR